MDPKQTNQEEINETVQLSFGQTTEKSEKTEPEEVIVNLEGDDVEDAVPQETAEEPEEIKITASGAVVDPPKPEPEPKPETKLKPETKKAKEIDEVAKWKARALEHQALTAVIKRGVPVEVASSLLPHFIKKGFVTFNDDDTISIKTKAIKAEVGKIRGALGGASVKQKTKTAMNPGSRAQQAHPYDWRANFAEKLFS